MSVDDLHLHGIYKLYIWFLTFTCTILVFTSKYDEFGGFFKKEIFWGPPCFDPTNISPQKKSLIQTTSFENWKNQTWN
jgi:hypothetical protein